MNEIAMTEKFIDYVNAKGHDYAFVDLSATYTENRYEAVAHVGEANAVSSSTRLGRHKPVLDLDIPHLYVPSSTEGHGHLLLDTELTWLEYVDLLRQLKFCGIIEEGYANAAIDQHKATWIRTPWTKKEL